MDPSSKSHFHEFDKYPVSLDDRNYVLYEIFKCSFDCRRKDRVSGSFVVTMVRQRTRFPEASQLSKDASRTEFIKIDPPHSKKPEEYGEV